MLLKADFDILEGPGFPVNPGQEYIASSEPFALTERGVKLYECAFTKVGMRVGVQTISSRRELDELVYRGVEILAAKFDAQAAADLDSGVMPAQFRDMERAYQTGDMASVLSAGSRLDLARQAGQSIVPIGFKQNRRE